MVPTALAAIGIVAVAGLLAQLWRVQRALRVVERELRAVRAEMGHAAITDPLTGLYNRRLLKQVASHQIEHHRRFRLPLCVVYIDVDRFKEINDTRGHAMGDRVLRHVAAFINRYTREADYLFRIGGDEFLVLMSCNAHEGLRRARELQAAFPRTLAQADLPLTLTVSVGVADVPTDTKDIDAPIQQADARMYEDKRRRSQPGAPLTLAMLLLIVAAVPAILAGQSRPIVAPAAAAVYARLLPRIEQIKLFDHHAHPGFADDPEVDAAPVPSGSLPFRLGPGNPDWDAAARALGGIRPKRGDRASWNRLLDRLGIETSVANRITMSDDLDPARFKWVFYADSFLFPFDNAGLAARNADQAAFMPLQTKLVQRFRAQAGLTTWPASLADYLAFVSRTLEDHKRRGAIAMKFEVAYFRTFVFDDPSREQASAVYDKYRAGGVPSAGEYNTFQDFAFRFLIAEGGRLHLPVHIHSSAGAGDYFSISGVNVLNLENILRDPRYGATTFVLIHGGYPFEKEAIFLAAMKNVYLDSSATGSFLLFPDAFKDVLRLWLTKYPDKITFGSDAFPLDDQIGAERVYWFGVHNARTALSAALAEMIAAREIREAQALPLARAYLHDTAAALYK
ncbi:MAG TPA: diguanylate cyclase [Vicinamibacterales bacterium]|nr:diguanylate cyclase [Vicinamibacterales bacterium]